MADQIQAASQPVRRLSLQVDAELAGERVDTLLKRQLGLSMAVVRRAKWLPDGILVDGQRVNTRFVPQPGQTLSVRLSDPERRSGIVPTPGALDIVYEDADVLVLNKAPGVCVHPGPGHFDCTIGNYLLHYYNQMGVQDDFHPVHRLDRGTSGLLVVAKHPHAQQVLSGQLHTGAFSRSYLAVCQGILQPDCGTVEAPLGPKPGSLIEQQVCLTGKAARTHYRVLQQRDGRCLLHLQLDTGRTHQIRVHMAHLGHPLIGDFLYGIEQPELIDRPALHSHRLQFLHPVGKTSLSFQLPLPPDMARLVED